MTEFASTIMNPSNLIAIAVAVLVFFTVITLGKSMTSGEQLDKRLKAVAQRREELRRQSRQQIVKEQSGGLRHKDDGMARGFVDKFNLRKLLEDPKVAENLAMAGFRGPKPISTFYFFRFLMPFVLGALATFYIFVVNDFGQKMNMKILICVAMFVAGYYAPNIYISNTASKRRQSIVAAFPDALDLLLICVEAGMSIETALHKVSQEIGGTSIPLAEEMSLLVAELSYLPERRQAYEGFSKRTSHPGIKSVCTAMIQAEKYGTPLGTALRVMAKENRELRLSAAEKKAAALPAQLTVPMIVFFLPVLFVVILGPAALKVIDLQSANAKGGEEAAQKEAGKGDI
ncbi:bacterial type II secretion system protein F domain protein [Asticcacaulis biprosthecium C19]|uniref:Bacterial type II secretion system protein F domain protein n=1 Tax=Asticcacaulis biprosthecium C19 TaxID=715226 RepID=F4QJ59_9CAUL|nr:type II secretion system F family protein [Asticcacaulis biprosthecium]EGF91890.1 bacterial type II secretion system protein F domain protein [Asticcacaulis biprosthecium C19]